MMKHMIKLPALLLGLMLLLTGTKQALAQNDNVSLQTFYDELSPYGTWIQDPEYGYVWRPNVDQDDFKPYYSNGRWAMTEYGNTWVSDYDWGWAPFHYGRWVTDRYNNWLWIPDTTWGPAWVSWRSGGGYYGWAPLGPRMGVSATIDFNIPELWWCFVPQSNIYYSNFPRYYSGRNNTIIRRTTYINNIYVRDRNSYYSGPRRDDIRRVTRRDVQVYSINRIDRPGRGGINNNNINIYRPRSDRNNTNAGRQAPRNVAAGSTSIENRGNRGENYNGNAKFPEPGRGGVRTPTNPQRDAQYQEQRQRQGSQFNQQHPQPDQSNAQRQQQIQQRQQANQQRQQQAQQQRQQADQQRQQQAQQQRQQADQQRQQQAQQQRQQADQQRQQQAQQQRQQADQQRQQQAQQQRQQADQQRQHREQQAQQQRQQQQRSSESRGGGERPNGRENRN